MADHKNAIVTLLHAGGVQGGDIRFAAMAAILNRSIEIHSPGIPLVVIVAGDFAEENLTPIASASCQIIRKPLFQARSGAYWRGNLSKLHAWNLLQFEKVLFLDADCWLQADATPCFDLPSFTCCPGPEAPMNGARMLLKPDRDTFYDLLSIADEYRFSPDSGWNEVGAFKWPSYPNSPKPDQLSDWRFNAAENDQGLFWYYFGLMKRTLSYKDCSKLVAAAEHVGRGERKFSALPPSYKAIVDEMNYEHYFGA